MQTSSLLIYEKKDVGVIPTSSTHIRMIEVEYLKDEVDKKKAPLMDSCSIMDTDILPIEAPLRTPAYGLSGTSSSASFDSLSSSASLLPPRSWTALSTSRPPLTQVALLWMGRLAHSADHHAAIIDASIIGMIPTTLSLSCDTLEYYH